MAEDLSPFNACATCGSSLRDGEWHPVVSEPQADGPPSIYSFCDDDCRDMWLADTATQSQVDGERE